MSLYAALPYVSGTAALLALWQAWSRPDGLAARVLRVAALGALSAFAFGRGTAPSALAAALVMSTVAHLIPPKAPPQWRPGSDLASLLGFFAGAYLFFNDGLGLHSLQDPAHWPLLAVAMLAAAALIVMGLKLSVPRPGTARSPGSDMEAGGLALLAAAAATVRFEHWPLMLGAALLVGAHVIATRAALPEASPRQWRAPAYWALLFAGQSAIAYPFLG